METLVINKNGCFSSKCILSRLASPNANGVTLQWDETMTYMFVVSSTSATKNKKNNYTIFFEKKLVLQVKN
jgi:hypothetical protein